MGLAAGAAIGASLVASAAATGTSGYDDALRVVTGVAFVAAGCYCPPRPRLAAAAILAVASLLGSGDAWPASVALGMALASVAIDTDGPALGAVVGLALGQAALRLDWPATTGASLLVGSAAFLVVAIPALLHVHRRTRRKLTVAGVIVAGAVIVVGGLWGVAALSVRDDLGRAVDLANAGLDAAQRATRWSRPSGSTRPVRCSKDAEGRLDSWWARPVAALPAAAQNARALRVMTHRTRALGHRGRHGTERESR